MAEEEGLPPLEVPWTLASSTQRLTEAEPDETAISLFVFEPEENTLSSAFPGERLLYLKFTASISPASAPPELPRVAVAALGEGIPCFHMLLDLRVRTQSEQTESIRPYFHSAAPLHRRMIQTGVVGSEVFEGEADAQFMGKSGSQMYESSSTQSRTTSLGASASIGYGPVSVGGSARRTSTDVTSERTGSQVVDTTTREASQERRDLVSHHTRVENVLTLLNAKYLGTPHLRFSLAPQPLHLLSLDPSDQNLWFSQLLQRRSSGIEGIQEFTAAVLVPRDDDFCVDARIQRVCVLDDPPGPLTYEEEFEWSEVMRVVEYLYRAYPAGTPLDELDVDLAGLLSNPDAFIRPVIESWFVGGDLTYAYVQSPQPSPGQGLVTESRSYKHTLEAWLDTLRDEYERDASRSPLERGVLLSDTRELRTCFRLDPGRGAEVSDSSASYSPLQQVDIDPTEVDLGGVMVGAASTRATARERGFEAVARTNLLEDRLATILSNRRQLPRKALRLDDVRVVGLLIGMWAKLRAGDPRNLEFKAAVESLHLGAKHRRLLKDAGATDLRGIARAVRHAPGVARYNERLARRTQDGDAGQAVQGAPAPITAVLSPREAAEIRRAIGAGLQKDMRAAVE
jgi:hypothetical protein